MLDGRDGEGEGRGGEIFVMMAWICITVVGTQSYARDEMAQTGTHAVLMPMSRFDATPESHTMYRVGWAGGRGGRREGCMGAL